MQYDLGKTETRRNRKMAKTQVIQQFDQSKVQGEVVLYQPDETIRMEVRLEDETVWLTQAQMAELFQTTRNNVTLHIGNIFREGELQENAVGKESLLTFAFERMGIDKSIILSQL